MKRRWGRYLISMGLVLISVICSTACSGEHEHKWSDWETLKEVTCTENGLQERTCKCGETETQQIAAPGHIEVADAGTEPTCTKEGLSDGSHCELCEEILTPQKKLDVV